MSAWKRGYDDAYLQWQAGRVPLYGFFGPEGEWRPHRNGFYQAIEDCRAYAEGRATLGARWRLWRAKWRTGT